MEKQAKQFKEIVEESNNILIVPHNGTDMDAFCSMLILKEFLHILYPNKIVRAVSKTHTSFNIPLMHDVEIIDSLQVGDEDLVIIVDIGGWEPILKDDDDMNLKNKRAIIIDHHQTLPNEEYELIINNYLSSATEQVLLLFKEIMGRNFKLNKDITQLGQYGIIADTGRFMYENTSPSTIRLFADLNEQFPIDIEDYEYKIYKIPFGANIAVIEFLNNIKIEGDMAYTYISNEFIEKNNLKKFEVNEAYVFIKDRYLRYIQGVHWGFIIKPSFTNRYKWQVSFRGINGYQSVGVIAEALGGGGHKNASGSMLEFEEEKTHTEVIEHILKAIDSIKSSSK
jgi:phosphoesterase RecJ-like protein